MRQAKTVSLTSTLRSLSDLDLDALRKALQDEGERRGRPWAQRSAGGFGRRQAG